MADDWEPVPEPITWTFSPITHNGVTVNSITLRAPTGADILKATAIPGASNVDVAHRLIEGISGVHYDVVKQLPEWVIGQMSDYLQEFAGAPAPDPLEQWRERRRARLKKQAEGEAAVSQDKDIPAGAR